MRLSAQGVNVPFRETPAHPVTVIVHQALEPRRLLVRFGAGVLPSGADRWHLEAAAPRWSAARPSRPMSGEQACCL